MAHGLLYLKVLQSTYKYLSTYNLIQVLNIVFGYKYKYTPAEIKKYLSKVQVLLNVYLKVLKYKYSCTWPHV